MPVNTQQQQLLKQLPAVDRLLNIIQNDRVLDHIPKSVLLRAIRETLDELRAEIINNPALHRAETLTDDKIVIRITQYARQLQAFNLQRVINATGVVVHTNLGRSCLSKTAIEHLLAVADHYSNLEFNLQAGRRGSRYTIVEDILCELSGAQAAMVVNNNAGAVLLCLDTLAHGKEVIISRGELVEIGGSFRIPDVMTKSGALLKEVGTTNRTHMRDYESAIGTNTGLLLKVHTSNYSIIGFTAQVPLVDLIALGKKFQLPVMEDLGSGNLIDFSRFGLLSEPTVQATVASGVDVVTFSGDKLLGGPQAGIIVGKKEIVDHIKANPLTRALRIDKLTLAALEATLRLYRDETQAVAQIPTLAMLTAALPELKARAYKIRDALFSLDQDSISVSLTDHTSRAGGGSLPMVELPSCCVAVQIQGVSANGIEVALRSGSPPIIGRIENDRFLLDPRTVLPDEIELIANAFKNLLENMNKGVLDGD
jgi:L-seryl-tRNA(Ser) seleniumtransferase